MLKGFFNADTENDPQGGESGDGKQRPTDVLDRFGRDALKLAEKLAEALSDNYTLREQRRTLRQEVTDLKANAPADGARVLTAEEASAYDAFAALGLKPADIGTALAERDTAKTELTSMKRTETVRTAAAAHGYKVAVLTKLPSLNGQDITIKDVDAKDGDGKPVKVKRAFVGDVALPDYIQQHDAEFLPALTDAPPKVGDGVGSPANGKRPAVAPGTLLIHPKATI